MNCKVCSNTTTNTPGIPFFRFPKEEKKCQRWAELCHLKYSYMKNGTVQFYKSFRICSDHFDADEMMHDGRKVRLFPSAEPKFLLKKYRDIKRKNKELLKTVNIAKITLPNHFCRLCAEEKKCVTSIYGWRGKTTHDLEKKLKYFPFAIDKCDTLPLGICQECMVKVDQFVGFIETCIEAQEKLKKLLDDEIYNLTVQIVDSAKEILVDSNSVPNQETQDISQNTIQTKSGGQDQIQSACSGNKQIQHVNEPKNTDLGKAQIQSFNGTLKIDLGDAQNTSLAEDYVYTDLSQLLNGIGTQTTNVDETQKTGFAFPSQPPLVSLECNSNNYVHFNLHQSLMDVPIVDTNQTEQNCPEPVPELMKYTDDDLLTMYGADTLHNDPNLNCTFADLPTCDQFAPSQMTDQTDIINANFDNIDKLNCGICLKDFETPEMLNSHLKAHCPESNDYEFEKYTGFHFFEDDSKKTKESDWKLDSSNTEPHGPLEGELEGAGSLLKENKSSLKRKRKKRRKTKPMCEFCEKLFPTFDECEEHEKTHQGLQRYECLICKRAFRSKRSLHRHIPVHSGEIFPCPHCESIFKRKDSLQNHGRAHRKLTCKICSFVFKQKAEFLKHEKDHELLVDQVPTQQYNAEQTEEEPDLPNSVSERDVPVPEAPGQFLGNTDTIQPTYIAVPNSKMDGRDQIVVTRIIAMEI